MNYAYHNDPIGHVNNYDNEEFFQEYAEMTRSKEGLSAAIFCLENEIHTF